MEGVFDADQLKSFMERIRILEGEKQGIQDDIKDIYAEAKAAGFHPATMRKCRALMKLEATVREEADALLASYRDALGIGFETTPLGKAMSDFQESMEDGNVDKVTLKDGEGNEVVLFDREKPKRGRPKKVRDPSDGGLVTLPPAA